jgi:hypothetical protein
MSSLTKNVQDSGLSEEEEPSFEPAEYTLRTSDGQSSSVKPSGGPGPPGRAHNHQARGAMMCPGSVVARNGNPRKSSGLRGRAAWTTGPPRPLHRSPGCREYWSTAGNRLHDSAKWMVAVLGAALATVIRHLTAVRNETAQAPGDRHHPRDVRAYLPGRHVVPCAAGHAPAVGVIHRRPVRSQAGAGSRPASSIDGTGRSKRSRTSTCPVA